MQKKIITYRARATRYLKKNKKTLITAGATFVVGCVIGYSSVA